jgi:hypothetical protein
MVLRSDDGNWVRAFSIDPAGLGARLISRNRIAVSDAGRLARALYNYVMAPVSLIMERRMLLGIKQRAERFGREKPATLAAGAGHRYLPDELGTAAFGRPDVERPAECGCAFGEVG